MINIEGHPNGGTLKDYALGNILPGMELLVSGHLTYCARCREQVAIFEELGAIDMALDPADVAVPSLDATLAMLDAPEAAVQPVPESTSSVFPTALTKLVKSNPDDINWSFRMPGLYEYEIPGFDGESVSLLKAKPGTGMLAHTHEGDEATLILQGAMADGDTVLRRGDVSQADDHHDHKPHIVGNEMCICLIVMSGKVKFTGTFSRALNILMR